MDVYTYAGAIDFTGYDLLCEALKKKGSDRALLMLATPGGDPHAGFRIARAMQHHYDSFEALVPRYCKSAGTLVLLGASKVYLDDMSELGPLDIQVKKDDEIVGRNSGLDILQAVNYLQSQTMTAFREYVAELTNVGLSTRVAADISSKLTTGLFEPIAAQVDPMKIAEMQRATEIAFAYGKLLAEKGGNLKSGGISKLVTGYPSHGFVIDRKEAKSIFREVSKPEGLIAHLSEFFHPEMWASVNSAVPVVRSYIPQQSAQPTQESPNEAAPNPTGGEGGAETGKHAHDGNPEADAPRAHGESTDSANDPGEAQEPTDATKAA